MSTDKRRHPAEFLDEVRAINARLEQREPQFDVATADQMRAANRDARRIMGQANEEVIDVDGRDERGLALLLALAHAADRRGVRPTPGPRAVLFIDLRTGRRGYCDVCDARAHIREEMDSQYGPYIYRARVCVRCRKFAPGRPVDDAA
jgi:hypothetical protein